METRYLERPRAPYASDPWSGRGRLIAEPPSTTRSEFQRDRDRVLHSAAFRRLRDKTQVFLFMEGDHHRTRLTHTLEVAQIARTVGRLLGLDEDLCEVIALAHDLGHTPFGHAGERALHRCMAGRGGFDHNAQTLRVVTHLERRYAAFDGINLTWEALEGLVKHNGPVIGADGEATCHETVLAYSALHDLQLASFAGPEAQVAALADDIAYDAHDLDDGLRAGLFTLDDLAGLSILQPLLAEVATLGPLDRRRSTNELVRRLIGILVEDVWRESARRIAALDPQSADDIRAASEPVIGFSTPVAIGDHQLKAFLFQRMYRHADVMRACTMAETVVAELFEAFYADSSLLGPEWHAMTPPDEAGRARHVADFVAGMTDRYAASEYRRLFDREPAVR